MEVGTVGVDALSRKTGGQSWRGPGLVCVVAERPVHRAILCTVNPRCKGATGAGGRE